MSEMIRWKNLGAVFADDLGRNNPKFSYTGTSVIKTPYGLARSFNGTSDKVVVGKVFGTVKTIALKVYLETNTEEILDFDSGTNTLIVSSGVLSVTSLADEIIYVNGVQTTSISSGAWHSVVFTTNTGLNVSNLQIGTNNSGFGNIRVKEVIACDFVWAQDDVTNYHLNKNFDYDKNIISRWNFDTTSTATGAVKDVGWKNNGFNGTVNGDPTLSDNPFGGKCLNLDGSGDYISLGNRSSFKIASKSISMWVRRQASGAMGLFSAGVNNYFVAMNGNNAYLTYADASNTQRQFTSSGTVVPLNQWVHLVFTFDVVGDNVTHNIWSNGVNYLNGSRTDGYSSNYGTNFLIGTFTAASLNSNACISKLVFFDKALSSIEVKDLYRRQRSGEEI
jgi:hypothetical protein